MQTNNPNAVAYRIVNSKGEYLSGKLIGYRYCYPTEDKAQRIADGLNRLQNNEHNWRVVGVVEGR